MGIVKQTQTVWLNDEGRRMLETQPDGTIKVCPAVVDFDELKDLYHAVGEAIRHFEANRVRHADAAQGVVSPPGVNTKDIPF